MILDDITKYYRFKYDFKSSFFKLLNELVRIAFKVSVNLKFTFLPYNIQRCTSSIGRPVYLQNSSTEIYW